MVRPKKTSSKTKKMTASETRQVAVDEFARLQGEASTKQKSNRDLRKSFLDDPKKLDRLKKKLTDDLLRVFHHECNPFAGFAASRQRYRQLGWYPEILVIDAFGNHAEFQRAAGLRDSRGTTKVKNLTARMATEQKIRDYAESCVLNHCGKHARLNSPEKWREQIVAVVVSDLHSRFVDPFAFEVALDVIEMVKPELVIINGDAVDFPKVGRYTKMPGATNLSLQDEINFTRDYLFAELRKRAPEALITWHIGNHEYRLIRYLADTAAELHDLDCLMFDELFGVDQHDIEMVFGNNFLSPRSPHFFAPRQKDRKRDVERRTWRIYLDAWAVTHGSSISKTPAADELRKFGVSGTSGHTHRPQVFTIPTAKCPTGNWMSTGMMANAAVGQHFVNGPTQWTMGFGVATIDVVRQEVIQQPVAIYQDWACYQGIRWECTDAARELRGAMWD